MVRFSHKLYICMVWCMVKGYWMIMGCTVKHKLRHLHILTPPPLVTLSYS